MATRACDACGARMSPWQPRKRTDAGELVCKGCEQRTGNRKISESDDHGLVYDPKTIPPGWGAHIGNGEWVTRCPEGECGHLIPGNLPVDIQRHLWDAHQMTAPILAAKQAGSRKISHDSGDGETIGHCFSCGAGQVVGRSDGSAECQFCFAGETEYLTWDGVRTLKETVGTTQRVLVHESFRTQTHKGRSRRGGVRLTEGQVVEIRDLYASGEVQKAELARRFGVVQGTIKKIVERVSWGHLGGGGHAAGDPVTQEAIWGEGHAPFAGRWVDAEIRAFGIQPLLKVTLSRCGITKEIHATPEHRWVVHPEHGSAFKYHQRMVRTTDQLTAGVRLASLFPADRLRQNRPTTPSPFGIAHGFVWGDGNLNSRGGSSVVLWGDKDRALLPYFAASRQSAISNKNGTRGVEIKDLPAFFKSIPPAAESLSYLYGWLAGYFAADGSVGEKGGPQISCANLGYLEQVRDLCTRLGVGTYAPTEEWRVGLGQTEPSQLWQMVLVGQTLTPDFFVIPSHRSRFEERERSIDGETPGWHVVSVEETDRVEEVYCAVVPGHENFTLVDNINVMNCGVVFTVQVQPKHSGTPQTIDGVPYDNPDMPGTPLPPGTPPAPDPNADPAENPFPDPAAPKGKKPPFFSSQRPRYYLTSEGMALGEDSYLKHLALIHADDRTALLRTIRSELK